MSLAVFVGGAAAQESPPLTRMMELNRAGRWEQAAEEAQRFLDAGSERSNEGRCEAYYHLAYARTHLGLAGQAGASLAAYESKCQGIASGHWLRREVARLREELGPGKAPPADDGFWRAGAPAALGMNVAALESHRRLCEGTGADACLVVRRGEIVQEFYSARYRAPAYAMSSTKSITGLLVGMLIDDGKIKSADEPVCTYIREWCEGRRGKVTIRHLLTMTSGLPRMYEEGVASTNDKNRYVIGLTPSREPGSAWAYSNEGAQLLSPIMDEAAGEPIQDYARRRLFAPLGMVDTRLHLDEKGHAWTYADMETTPRDLARVGLLMLNKGVWQGQRVVSAAWVEQSTRRSQEFEPRYGLLWWLYDGPKGYAALGYLDTNLYVFPGQELVVVRMQSKPSARQAPYEPEALRLFGRMIRR
jgi:CubicO group peptidase (beta-lactamase class C family)